MQPGTHILEREQLGALEKHGVSLPQPWTGLLDVLRMVEGMETEPPAGKPLVLTGLTGLLVESPDGADALLRVVRGTLGEGRSYFSWKKIPLVFVVRGRITDPQDGTGLYLEADRQRWSLAPLLGSRMTPAQASTSGWWWSPQWL